MGDIFELSFRWQDGFIQFLIYCAIISAGLYLLSKIEIKEREEDNE
jgi:hypothetical protein